MGFYHFFNLKAWQGWLASYRMLNALGKEFAFDFACHTRSKRRRRVKSCLKKMASRTGKPWQTILSTWFSATQRIGVDASAYGLWVSCTEAAEEKITGLAVQTSAQHHVQVSAHISVYVPPLTQLAKNALVMIDEVFSSNPDVVVVYVDHDYMDSNGVRHNPHFKPDWNRDFFYSSDYIGSSVFFRSEWLDALPEPFNRLDGQTLLRVLPLLEDQQIRHVPRVLYHYHASFLPTQNGQRADLLQALFSGCADVSIQPGLLDNTSRISFPLPTPPPLVSILIPTRDRLDILKPCVESILRLTTYGTYEILVVDNGSEQAETLAWFSAIQQDDQRVRVLAYPQPFNYSAINNFAVRHARGSVLALVNNDIEVISPAWLGEMVSHACRPEIGCVGAKLYYADGRIQHAGVILGSGGGSGHAHRYFPGDADGYCGRLKVVQNFTAVTGACLVVRKTLYEQVGGLNEVDLPIAWSDIDLCLKVRALGYRNLWTPYAELYHHESVSRGRDRSKAQRQRYRAETAYMRQVWGDALWQDPCYNPNLTVAREDFSLGLPLPCRWP